MEALGTYRLERRALIGAILIADSVISSPQWNRVQGI